MAQRFLRLKLALLGGSFRRSTIQLVGMVIAVLYASGITVAVMSGLSAARAVHDVGLVRDLVIVAGALVTFGFAVVPLLFGVDDVLDPRRFALFGIESKRLALGLAIGALVSVPSIALVLCSATTLVTWSRGPLALLLALIGAAAGVATCVLASRVAASVASFALASRRGREASGVIGILLLFLISPAAILLGRLVGASGGRSTLHHLADVLRWTPLAAAWSAPADATAHHPGAALLETLIALAVVGALWLTWQWLVAVMLVTPGHQQISRSYGGLGWFRLLPATGWGVVAARSLSYWGRDARYWVSLIMIPLIPVILLVALLSVDAIPGHYAALVPVPVMALFLGWSAHNDVAYDGTAIWLHVVAGARGISDRVGRLVPLFVLGVPLVVVGSLLSVGVYGDWSALPGLLGASAALLLTGLGLSCVTSALFPYPVAKPGDSPFQQPQSSNAISAVVQALSLLVIVGLSAPAVWLAVLGVFRASGFGWGSLVAGLFVGVAALVVGVYAGAAIFERRGPELLDSAVRAA